MIKRTLAIVFILLVFTSCFTSAIITDAQIAGEYQWHSVYGVGATMKLNENQTFEYNWWAGLSGGATLGKWEKDGRKIILVSNKQLPAIGDDCFKLLKTVSGKSDSLLIKVLDLDSNVVPYASCYLKQDNRIINGASTNFMGEAKLQRIVADSLIITVAGYKSIRYKIDSSISSYTFKIGGEDVFYKYFENEVWRFRKGRLYDPSIKKNKYVRKTYFEKEG